VAIHDQITVSFFTPMTTLLRSSPVKSGDLSRAQLVSSSHNYPEGPGTISAMEGERVWQVTHVTTFDYDGPVEYSYNEAHLHPRNTDDQRCLNHRLEVTPEPTGFREFFDPFGNWVSVFSVRGGFNHLSVTAVTEVARATPVLPPSGLPWESARKILDIDRQTAGHDARRYRACSRMVPTGPMFAAYAAESFQPCRPLVDAAVDLAARIHRDFVYQPGFTSIATPLSEVLEHRRGVCQDFAHLMIACLRSIGLACRYISGYIATQPLAGVDTLIGAGASHAWASIYVPGWGWLDLDPTNDQLVGQSHVTAAWGRDYYDVSPLRGSVEGGGRSHRLDVAVDVQPLVGSDSYRGGGIGR
jgi:transglutaminase-like putative cysteine protease